MEMFDNKGRHSPDGGKKPRRGLRRLMIALCILAAVAAAAIVGYSIWEKPPDISSEKHTAEVTPAPGETQQSEKTGDVDPGDPDDPVDDFDGALDTERDDGVYTFLLVGRDHESNSTDTVIVGKFDTVKHSIDCVNIPRDTLINISWGSTPKKINAVYPGYTNSGKSGIDGLKTHIRNLLGFDVDCYAVVNLKVVEDVINEIGGVYFDVPLDMDYDDGAQHFHVHLKQGYQQLNGYEALGVFRYRYGNDGNTYPGGDLERIGVQQDLMKSIAAQMLSLGNIPNLGNVIELCVENVETDLNASNMAFFARQFLKCSMADVNFHTAPYANNCWINDISYVSLDVDKWLEMVNDCLNPYTEKVTVGNVNILTADYEGSVMTATTGVIAGGQESMSCNHAGCLKRFSYHLPGQHVYAEAPELPEQSGEEGETPGEEGGLPEENGEAGEVPGEEGGESTGPEIIDAADAFIFG